jgi:hypothetical protein
MDEKGDMMIVMMKTVMKGKKKTLMTDEYEQNFKGRK